MWEQTLATARAAAIPTDSMLDATARVFIAQDTFTQAMSNAYRQRLTAQILEREEERSALVEALLSHRITDSHSLWEAADLLRLPTSGPYVVVAAELPAIGKLGLPTIENKLSAPRHPVGVAAAAGLAGRHRPSAGPRTVGHPRHTRRGVKASRDRASRHQSAVSRAGRNQRRAAIRPAGGHRKAVGRFTRHRLRRHPACGRGGQRPGGDGKDQVVGARARSMSSRPRSARSCWIPSRPGCKPAAPPTTPRRRSIATPTPCGTACTASRS